MARVASPFNIQRANLDICLDRLSKYANLEELKGLPGFSALIRDNVNGARAAFGNMLEMLGQKLSEEKKDAPAKKES